MTDRQAKTFNLSILTRWHNLARAELMARFRPFLWGAEGFRRDLLDDGGGRLCWFIGGPADGQQVPVPPGLQVYNVKGSTDRFMDFDASLDARSTVELCRYFARDLIVWGRRVKVFVAQGVRDESAGRRLLEIVEARVQEYERALTGLSYSFVVPSGAPAQ